jgi:DNA repair protein RecO (recombination protein O)
MINRDFYSTEGIVLRRIKYKENGIIFTVLTKEWGRMGFLSKSALRSNESRDAASTEVGNHIEITFHNKPGNSLQIPKRIVLKDDFIGIKQDYEKFIRTAEILKDVFRLLPDHEKNEKIFNNLLKTLGAIERYEFSSVDTVLIIFRITLLAHLGYLPPFNRCAVCGRNSEYYAYSKESGPVCHGCIKLEKELILLPKHTRLFFENVKENLDTLLNLPPEEVVNIQLVLTHIINRVRTFG